MATTLAALKTRAREIADMPARADGGGFVTDAELVRYINQAASELHNLCIAAHEDYATTVTTFTLSGVNTFSLPADFAKIQGLDYSIGGSWVSVRPFVFAERNAHALGDRAYRLVQGAIFLLPENAADGTYRLWYARRFNPLASDSDEIDDLAGGDEYVALGAAMRMLRKEDSDVSVVMADRAKIELDIRAALMTRDAGEASHVAEVRDEETECRGRAPWR